MPIPYTHTYSPLTYVGSKRTTIATPTPDTLPASPILTRLEDFYDVLDQPQDGSAKPRGTHKDTKKPLKDYQYREPFFGGGNVGLRFVGRLELSSCWLNDYDPGTSAYWNAVLKEPDALCTAIAQAKPTEDTFTELTRKLEAVQRKHVTKPVNPITMKAKKLVELAFLKHVTLLWSFGAKGGAYSEKALRKRAAHKPAESSLFTRIHAASRTLNSVNLHENGITCLSYEQLVTAPGESFVYCDPPYTQADTSKHYAFNFTPVTHRHLIGLLRKRKNWMLSYDLSAATMTYLGVQEAYNEKTGLHLEVCQSNNSLNAVGERMKEEIVVHDS